MNISGSASYSLLLSREMLEDEFDRRFYDRPVPQLEIFVRGGFVFSWIFIYSRSASRSFLTGSTGYSGSTYRNRSCPQSIQMELLWTYSDTEMVCFCPELYWALFISTFLPYACCRMPTASRERNSVRFSEMSTAKVYANETPHGRSRQLF